MKIVYKVRVKRKDARYIIQIQILIYHRRVWLNSCE